MAINIQEILHPSDSNQIKWEKVNYNFDQILANGGGPTGQKGAEGVQGSVGQTGQKGQKGDIGPQGETGATTSRWKVIPINANGGNVNEYVILKPKLSNDNYHPVIFLGDQEFDEVNNFDGQLLSAATLTIGKHAVGGSTPSSELVSYWHGKRGNTDNNISITLSTSEQTDGSVDWTRYTLAETYGTNLNTVPAEIIEYFVNLDKYTFKSNVGFDDSSDNVFRLPGTSVDTTTLKGGEIRYYADTFWGAVKDSNGNVSWKEFCTSPCGSGGVVSGTVEIVEDPADLNLNQYGGLINQTIEIVPGGDLVLDDEGAVWNGAATTTLATTTTTLATTTAAPEVYTIQYVGDITQFNNVSYNGGIGEISYSTGPIDGLIISSSKVTKPSWVTISSFQDQTTFSPELNFTVEANGAGARSGNIVIEHPNDATVKATLNITQVADPNYGAGCMDPNADNYDPNAGSDDGSCTYCANFTAVESSKNNPSSYGASDGSYAMTATGGSANYDYSVYRTSDNQQVNPFALTAGTYYGVITDLGTNAYGQPIGCTDRIDFTLTDPATSATTQATAATTAPTNATAATTQATNATAATTLAAEYTAIVANPSGTVDEGQNVSITVTGNYIPNGTRVWVNMNLGQATQQDVTSGWSSGAGAGDSPSNSSWGNWVTMNNNTGSHTITIKNDNLLEGGETITFSLLSYDEAGNATGSKQTSVTINDTSYPQTHTVTFINGNYDQYSTCQMTSNTKTATYTANPNGQATWTTVADAVMNDSDYAGSGGVWFKIVSSTEPGFQWNNTTANHSAPITGQACSNVTTTAATTTPPTTTNCNRYTHSWSNNGNYPIITQYTDCGVSKQITTNPYSSSSICADLLSAYTISGSWSNFQVGTACGSGGGGSGSGSGSGA